MQVCDTHADAQGSDSKRPGQSDDGGAEPEPSAARADASAWWGEPSAA